MTMQVAPPDDGRRLKSQQSRAAILDAAYHCFAHGGIAATSMEHIAQQAGMGRATLYRHFTNQQGLLREVLYLQLNEISDVVSMKTQGIDDASTFLIEACTAIIRECRERTLLANLLSDAEANAVIEAYVFDDEKFIAMGKVFLDRFCALATAEQRLRPWLNKSRIQEWISFVLLSFLRNLDKKNYSDRKIRAMLGEVVCPSLLLDTAAC